MPCLQRLGQRMALVLGGEVEDDGGAARERRRRAGSEAVRRDGGAGVHLEVGVRVYEAGEEQAALSVPALVKGQLAADGDYLAVLYEEVGFFTPFGAHDGAVFNAKHGSHTS